jgi:undecaprenyl diphosphate synthase
MGTTPNGGLAASDETSASSGVTARINIPAHIGIIMDGNGRWAQERKLPRSEGHREGLKTAKRIVKAARELGVRYLSFYAFSTENWKRAQEEVSFLMRLIVDHLGKEFDFYRENNVRVIHSGRKEGLPPAVLEEILHVEKDTARNDSIVVNLAINYGGRDEILRAVNSALLKKTERGMPPELCEEEIRSELDTASLPDPDLIIRTAGEFRLSNFLLWGSAYAEFYSSQKYWPDWEAADLRQALDAYGSRQRLFGGKR